MTKASRKPLLSAPAARCPALHRRPARACAAGHGPAAARSWTCSLLPPRWRKPPVIRTQSRQKQMISASAVATCGPTMNARCGDSGVRTFMSGAPLMASETITWPSGV